jgi:hypothetical protein
LLLIVDNNYVSNAPPVADQEWETGVQFESITGRSVPFLFGLPVLDWGVLE